MSFYDVMNFFSSFLRITLFYQNEIEIHLKILTNVVWIITVMAILAAMEYSIWFLDIPDHIIFLKPLVSSLTKSVPPPICHSIFVPFCPVDRENAPGSQLKVIVMHTPFSVKNRITKKLSNKEIHKFFKKITCMTDLYAHYIWLFICNIFLRRWRRRKCRNQLQFCYWSFVHELQNAKVTFSYVLKNYQKNCV